MKKVGQIFFNGLITVLPVAAIVYSIVTFYNWAETLLNGYVFKVFPGLSYIPGLGIMMGATFVFVVGLLMGNIVSKTLFGYFERALNKVPIISSIYSAIKDLMSFFKPAQTGEKGKVVSVKWPGQPVNMIGFVTNEDLKKLLPGSLGEQKIAVYFPMSYQVGGYTAFIPADWATEIDMKVEEAMRSAVTAWVKK